MLFISYHIFILYFLDLTTFLFSILLILCSLKISIFYGNFRIKPFKNPSQYMILLECTRHNRLRHDRTYRDSGDFWHIHCPYGGGAHYAYPHTLVPTWFKNVPPDLQATRPIARGPFKNRMANYSLCYCWHLLFFIFLQKPVLSPTH